MNIDFTLEKIRNTALLITSVAFFLVVSYLLNPDFFKSRLDYDVFKLTYQFLLLTVIGGFITFLFTFYVKLREDQVRKKEQDDAREKEKKLLQRKFYSEFIQLQVMNIVNKRLIWVLRKAVFVFTHNLI